MMIMKLLFVALICTSVSAAPYGSSSRHMKRFGEPVVKINKPESTIRGTSSSFLGVVAGGVESFKGIPFAQPPLRELRFKPPVRLVDPQGDVDATTDSPAACPQFTIGEIKIPGIPPLVIEAVKNSPLLKNLLIGEEDCLTINVQRPAGVTENDKLPVLFWIFGGGFELGSTSMYDGSNLVSSGVAMGKPFIFVAVNYRVGGFGFMPGKEILADGSANAGLLDQRMGMEWVQDNIASFG
jgi:carboxylesterase type B